MSRLVEIDINQIIANPYQPRTTFDKDSLTELSQSILENGLIQPIVVRESMNGKYEIVAGERRFKAANMAGYQKVPCIVQEYTDLQSAQIALIENIQRENLSPIEEAEAFQTLIAMTGMTQQELALKVGKRQSTIANKLRLLKLPESVKEALKEKKMTERHARAMLSVTDQRVIDEITKKGYKYFDWNQESGDAKSWYTLTSVMNSSLEGVDGNRDIMLLCHEKAIMVETLPTIIEYYLELGYIFLPITENTPGFHHKIN